MTLGKHSVLAATIGFVAAASVANATFVPFIIRGDAEIEYPAPGQIEFILDQGGEKAGLGSNAVNGFTLGSLQSVAITRLDDRTRFTAGSGPYVAPYLNIWITDGFGRYAVVANEPSDPDMQPLYSNGWDFSFSDLSDKAAKIYETSDKSWLPNSGNDLTFADLANFIIRAPSVSDFATPWAGLGSGAPRELSTNVAYGVNWVFGDTLANYVSGQDGYIVSNASVRADAASVPETASLSVLLLSVAALAMSRLRFRSQR